jgi:hypothetical protein
MMTLTAWRQLLRIFLLSWLGILVHGSALTTPIAPNERLCFYADVDKAGEKIGVSATLPVPYGS